ncbi:MAG: NUDIX hydrolase [Candidatus Makaraimicrobium thalassicum]|nr:MAG: NUDIX hydrolase [Candidatus Omnitrophota bacterium]
MERHFSAGGVVIKKERGRPKVLLIKDGYGRWTWPKGHIEKGESPEQAAIREISEETGQKKIEVVEELGKQQYYFTLKGKKIFKTVYIFLVKAAAREKLAVQTSEVQCAGWFRPEEAAGRIEYKGSRSLLEEGIDIFRRKFC